MIVTTGQRVTRSFGSAALSLSAMISCSKLRVSISAPKPAASDLRGFEIDRGVDGHHHAAIEQRLQRVLDADLEAIGQILHRHAFGEGDGARDRRRRGRRGRLLRALQRIALLRRLQAATGDADAAAGSPAASAAGPDAAACRVAGRTGCDGSGRGPPSIAAVLLCSGRG